VQLEYIERVAKDA
ncbi:putative membrane protein, partial [Vibrio parahaemolyticus V-223/04]